MFRNIFLPLIILGLLSACGGGGGEGGGGAGSSSPPSTSPRTPTPGNPRTPTPAPINVWAGVGAASIPQNAQTSTVEREVEFGDGMTVSYDATDPENEEVCRTELVGSDSLSICMNLDDGEAQGEDFEGEITCRINEVDQPDCDEVYQRLTDAGFSASPSFLSPYWSQAQVAGFECAPGIFRGDKALECNDDWAVVVNGEDGAGNGKAICRVHLTQETGRCLGAPKQVDTDNDGVLDAEVAPQDLILEMQQTRWVGYLGEMPTLDQVLYTEGIDPIAVRDAPANAVLHFESRTPEVCSVDNDDDAANGAKGRVIPDPDASNKGVCRVLLKIAAPGFVDQVFQRRIETVEDNDTTWDGYTVAGGVLPIGESLAVNAPADPIPEPFYVYTSTNPRVCSVDRGTGEITALAGGNCQIQLLASSLTVPRGYLVRQILAPPVTVRGEQGIAWVAVTSAVVGTDLELDPVSGNAVGAVVSYQILSPGTTGCAWQNGDPTTLTLEFSGAGTCQVRATSLLTGFESWEQIEDINVVLQTQTGLAWSPSQSAGTVGTALTLDAATGTADADQVIYELSSNDDGSTGCVFESARTLTFTDAGNCTVQVRTTRATYEDWTQEHTIAVGKGDQTLSWAAPTTGKVGADLTLPAPTGATGTISYTVNSQGTTGCSESSGVLSFTGTGDCEVSVSVELTGYNDWTDTATITVSEGAIEGVSWNPEAAFNSGDTSGALGGVVGALGSDTVTYEVVAQGGTSCAFTDPTTSTLTFGIAGTCVVQATVERDQYNDWESPAFDIEITSITPIVITWAGYANSNVATIGQTPPALSARTYNPTNPDSNAYEFIAVPSGVCSVDPSTGALSLNGVGSCVVTHTATKSGSGNGRKTVIVSINPGTQTVIPGTPYTNPSSFAVGDTLALGTAPTGEKGNILYRSTDSAICTLATNGDITATGEGSCVVQAQFEATANYLASAWTQIHTITVDKADQAAPTATDTYGSSSSLVAGGTLEVVTPPSGGGQVGVLEYQSSTPTICSVNSETGEVSGLSAQQCTITARWSGDVDTNPSPPLQVLGLTIAAGGAQLVPSALDPYGQNPSVQFGENLAILTPPVGDGTPLYSTTTPTICSVGTSGDVTGDSIGSCLISASWPATTSYPTASAVVPLASIEVTRGDQAAPSASDIYGTTPSLSTGGRLIRSSDPAGGGASGSARYQTTTESICSVAAGTGLITALSDGACIIQARWSGDATYLPSPWQTMQTVTIAPIAFEMARWGEFRGKLTVGGDTRRPSKSRARIRRVEYAYALDSGETDCTLEDAQTGEVRANAVALPADCSLEISASREGYSTLTQVISIPLQGGTLAFATAPSYSSAALAVGTTLAVQNAGATDDKGINVAWNYSIEGKRAGVIAAGICVITSGGDVSLGASARVGDVCHVFITASADGYEDYPLPEVALTVSGAQLAGLAWNSPSSGKIGTDLDLGAVSVPGSAPVGLIIRYQVSDKGTAKCYLRGIAGALRHTLGFSAAGTCEVKASATHPQYADWESIHTVTITGDTITPTTLATANATCLSFSDGGLKCWGRNNEGQLGLGNTNNLGGLSHQTGGGIPWVDVSADGVGGVAQVFTNRGESVSHACAILQDGRLKCWGKNDHGQLGLGHKNDLGGAASEMGSNLGVVINPGHEKSIQGVAMGGNHTCAILDDGNLKCWGSNSSGQLGLGGGTSDVTTPGNSALNLGTSKTALEISAGLSHTCARLDDNTVKCWGRNNEGQLGLGDTTNRGENANQMGDALTVVNLGQTAKQIAAGNTHTCALLNDDSVKCWGQNNRGQLGIGSTADQDSPQSVDLGTDTNNDPYTAKKIVAGYRHTCVILNDDKVNCWGENDSNQLGRGGARRESPPATALDLGGVGAEHIAAGFKHTCALLADNTLKCWGANGYGQLGLGDRRGRTTPTRVPLFGEISEFGTLAWASFPGSVDVGETLTLSDPTSTPAFDEWVASVLSGDCVWDQSTKALEFTGLATCTVSLTVSKGGYVDEVELFSVTPSPLTQANIAWNPTQTEGTVGTELPLSPVANADATVVYEVEDAGSTSCYFKGTTDPEERTLIFLSAGTCQVIAVSSGGNYLPWESAPFSISVKHPQVVNVPTDAYGGTSPTLTIPNILVLKEFPKGGQGRPEYRPKDNDETYCKVDPDSGRVTPVAPGNCEVEVRFPASGEYYASNWEAVETIVVSAPLEVQPNVAWNPTQNRGIVGDDLVLAIVGGTDASARVEYLIANMGDTDCAFKGSGDPDERTLIFKDSGTCIVQARSKLAGHFDWRSHRFSISVKYAQPLTVPSKPYGDNLNLASGFTLSIATEPSGGNGNLEYRSSSASAANCDVDADGKVTGKDEGSCVIEVRWGESSTHYASTWEVLATIVVVPPPDPKQTGLAWAAPTSGKVGQELVLPVVSGEDQNAQVSYTITSQGTTACAWKDGDVTTLTLVFSDAGTCEIRALSELSGHQNWDSVASIVVVKGTQTALIWAPAQSSGAVGVDLVLDAVTGAGLNGANDPTYAVSDAGATGCAFGSGDATKVRTLKFTNAGTCKVRASVSRTGYEDWPSPEISISVIKGTQTGLAWAVVGSPPSGKVGETTTLPEVTGAENADNVSYEKTSDAGNSICLFSGRDLTFSDSGTCIVRAVVTRTGYDSLTLGPVSITVAKGTLTTISWNVGTTSFVKGATPLLPQVSGMIQGDVDKYTVSDAGTTQCAFSSGRTLGLPAAGTCKVKATLTRTGYDVWEREVSLTITNAPPVQIAWDGYGTGANKNKAKVGENAPTLQAPTLNPATATAGYTTSSAGVCGVTSVGVLTILGKGDCVVKLTATPVDANNVAGTFSVTVAVERGDQTVTPASNPYGNNPSIAVDGTLPLANPPTGRKESATITYQSTDSSICSVDENDGEITAHKVASCVVQAQFAQTANYEESVWTQIFSITPGKGRQNAPSGSDVYGNPTPTLAVGETISVETAPSGGGEHGGLVYTSSNTDNCSVAPNGDVTGKLAKACEIKAHWKGNDDYLASAQITVLTLIVGKGTQGVPVASNPYGQNSQVKVDTDSAQPTAPTGGYGSVRYSSPDSTFCWINPSNGVIRGVKKGTCNVHAQWTGDINYLASSTAPIASVEIIPGDQTPPTASNIYGDSPSLAVGVAPLARESVPSGGDAHGDVRYQVTTPTICDIDADGKITPKLNGGCTVQARYDSTDDYLVSPWVTMQTVMIDKGTIQIITLGSFSGTLIVGGSSLTPTAPVAQPAGTTIKYGLKQGESDCTLLNPSTGEVGAKLVAVVAGTTACTVVATIELIGYNSEENEFEVLLGVGTLAFDSVGHPNYSGTLRTGATLALDSAPAVDDSGVSVVWSYSARGERYGGARSNVCSIDGASGLITVESDAQVGDACRVVATAKSDGFADYIAPATVLAIVGSEQTGPSWTPAITTTKLGQDIVLGPIVLPNNYPAGSLALYRVTDSGTAGCYFRGLIGDSAHTLAVQSDGTCKVRAVNTHPAYADWESTEHTITVNENTAVPTQISTWQHTCVRFDDGGLKCWGNNTYGKLGYGHERVLGTNSLTPDRGGAWPWVDVSADGVGDVALVGVFKTDYFGDYAGVGHSCAVLNDGSLKCWGNDERGQLGITNTRGYVIHKGDGLNEMGGNLPLLDLGNGRSASTLSLGQSHSCALLDDDTVKCWGHTSNGRLGRNANHNNNARNPHNAINLGSDCDGGNTCTASAIALGGRYSCVIVSDGRVKCWGLNDRGQLGVGSTSGTNSGKTAVDLGSDCNGSACTATAISAGWKHTCALLNDDRVKCWGDNGSGRLGVGNTTRLSAPGAAADLGSDCNSNACTATAISAGWKHTCALLNDNRIKCWGENEHGQLGLGNTTDLSAPGDAVDLGLNRTALAISAGMAQTCAILDNHVLKCWGRGSMLGLGGGINRGDGPNEMGEDLPAVPLLAENEHFSSLDWPSFPATAAINSETVALGDPDSTPVFDQWRAQHLSGDCTWNGNTKKIAFGSTTSTCRLALSVGLSGHASYSKIFSVVVGLAPQSGLDWTPINVGAFGIPGVDLVLNAVTGADSSAAIEYFVTDQGNTGCVFGTGSDAAERTLSFSGAGTCRVRAISLLNNYEVWPSPIVSIQVKLPQSNVAVPTNPYGDTLTISSAAPLTLQLKPVGGQGSLEYQSSDTQKCTVDSDGKVTSGLLGECTIRVRWAGNDQYAPSEWADLATIEVIPIQETIVGWYPKSVGVVGTDLLLSQVIGTHNSAIVTYEILDNAGGNCGWKNNDATTSTLTFTGTGTCKARALSVLSGHDDWANEISVMAYSDTVQSTVSWTPTTTGFVGVDLDLTAVSGADASAQVDYTILNEGQTGCAWTGTSGTAAHTLRTTGEGSCWVRVTVSLSGHSPWQSETQEIVFSKRTQTLNPPTNPYGRTNLDVGTYSRTNQEQYSRYLAIVNPPTGGHGSLEYRLSRNDYGGGRSLCFIKSDTGALAAGIGVKGTWIHRDSSKRTCVVQARWSGNDFYKASDWVDIATMTGVKN